ncbi:hypothetical protein B0H16DRAFT_1623429 [Mycena metata]|uniref:Uncharacterized protein n=1 Tax=Mycena metata TaxID=1033252 RepID=A0AAD7H5H1_9AGAR|nr:hypothetical protein B0H16DRAFT_1623429 [Mycena metata]
MSLRPSFLFLWVATILASGVAIGAAGAGSGLLPRPRADIQTYNWGFTGSFTGSNLAACATVPLGVYSGSQQSTGVPPYYMMAFPVSGTPMTSLIGTDASALEWTVAFPVGTLLLLGVVDSLGTSGGIDTGVYTVIGGSTTQCIPSDSRPAFTITSNLTSGSTLSTCDGWQLSILGGTPPYKVTLAPSNSADVVNVTLGPNDSVFNYLNQSPPGSQLLAAVSDSTGRWATDGPTVQTSGSNDMTCNGLSSSSGPTTSSSPVSSPSVSPTAHSGISHKTIAIIGGSVGGLVLLLAFAAIFLCARRRRDRELEWSGSAVAPARPVSYSTPAAQMPPLNSSFSAMTGDGSISGPAPETPKGEMYYPVASPGGWDGRYAHMPLGAAAPSMHMTHESESHITMTAAAGPSTSLPPTSVASSSSIQELPPPYINTNPGQPRQTDGKRNLQVVGPSLAESYH